MHSKISIPLQKRLSSSKEELVCSEAQVRDLALRWSKVLKPGDVIALEGELGAGKSTFAKYVLEGFGHAKNWKGSPTFPLVHEYSSVVHIDLYRVDTVEEREVRGLETYFWDENIVLVEWLSKHPDLINSLKRAKSEQFVTIQIGEGPSATQRTVKVV